MRRCNYGGRSGTRNSPQHRSPGQVSKGHATENDHNLREAPAKYVLSCHSHQCGLKDCIDHWVGLIDKCQVKKIPGSTLENGHGCSVKRVLIPDPGKIPIS